MNVTHLRVVKVGGSLYGRADLPQRLAAWLDTQPDAVNVLVPGGGDWVETVRRMDREWILGDDAAHWIAVELLRPAGRLLASIVQDGVLASPGEMDALCRRQRAPRIVLDVPAFLREIESRLAGNSLPASWDATSDSIAARAAQWLGAEELVLLKSTVSVLAAPKGPADPHSPSAQLLAHAEAHGREPSCGPAWSLDDAANCGLVDRRFPDFAAGIARIRVVDLASPGWPPFDERTLV